MTLNGASGDDVGTPVLVEVFRSVLASVGVTGEGADRLLDQVMTEYRGGAGACTLRFAARAGEIQIAFSRSGRDLRTSCPVPVR
jgi:hypothetical protein